MCRLATRTKEPISEVRNVTVAGPDRVFIRCLFRDEHGEQKYCDPKEITRKVMGDQPYHRYYAGYGDTFDRGDEISPQPNGQKIVPYCHLARKLSGSS